MKEQNDDIFNHLKSVLRDHEEPYDEGAWERFAAKGKAAAKKAPVIAMWKWAVAAAVIAGVALGVFNMGKEDDIDKPLAVDVQVNNKPADSSAPSGNNALVRAEQKENISSFDKEEKDMRNSATAVLPQPFHKAIVSQTGWARPDTVLTPSVRPEPGKQPQVANAPITDKQQAQPVVDFWKNKVVEDNRQEQKPVLKDNNSILIASASEPTEKKKRSEKSSKWQPGIFISPLFGDLGMNMGYGFSLGYAINDKIKISSGVAHTKITASRSYDAASPSLPGGGAIIADQPTGPLASGSLKTMAKTMSNNSYVTGPQQVSTLQQIDGSLSGIDIPVDVNYNIGKKLYASAGVSGLVVINDNRKYTYLDSRNEKVSVQSSNGSQKEDRSVMFNEQSVTSRPIAAAGDHIPFLGFYNLSVGFRQKLPGKNAVSVEPFIKVPMQGATRQNLNYNGSGIRLKFDF